MLIEVELLNIMHRKTMSVFTVVAILNKLPCISASQYVIRPCGLCSPLLKLLSCASAWQNNQLTTAATTTK